MDIVVNNLDAAPSLLRNDGGNRGPWLMVKCRGVRSNRSAIGARVTITAGGRSQTREVMSGSSYYSHSDLRLHFGLGAVSVADRLEIRWPAGLVESYSGVPADHLLHLEEGKGIVRRERFEAAR